MFCVIVIKNLCLQDEIFDMVKPKDPYKITLQDLVNSGQGDTVSSILIDLNGFWTYENREVLVANDTDSNTADLDDTWHHILLPNQVVLLDQLSYSERGNNFSQEEYTE